MTAASPVRRLLRWLYGPPRTRLGVVRYIAVYLGQGLLLALLLMPLPEVALILVVTVVGVYVTWQSSPYIGRHVCEVCGTHDQVLPVWTDPSQPWVPWRRTRVRWMCPKHWQEDLMLRAYLEVAAQENKDRPGG
jgi:hypothetical protein